MEMFFLFLHVTYIMVRFKVNGSCMQWHNPLTLKGKIQPNHFISLNIYFYLLKRTSLDSLLGNVCYWIHLIHSPQLTQIDTMDILKHV